MNGREKNTQPPRINPPNWIFKYVHPAAEHKKTAMLRYDLILKEVGKKAEQQAEGRTN